LERLGVGGARTQEEELVLYDRVEESRRVGVGEMNQRRSRVGM
jgi:hypothetical protein